MLEHFETRAERSSFVVLALVFLAMIGVSFSSIATRIHEPYPGFVVWENLVVPAIGAADWPGIQAGVPLRSVLESVGGVPLADSASLQREVDASPPGTELEYRFRRDGSEVTSVVPTGILTWRQVLPVYLPYAIAGISFFAVGLIVFYFRPELAAARAALALGSILGTVLLLAPDVLSAGWLSRFYFVCESLMPAVLLHFGMCFPEERPLVVRYSWLRWAPYAVFLPLGLLQSFLLSGRPELHLAVNGWVYTATAGAGFFLVAALVWSYLGSTNPIARQQAKVVLAGVVVAAFIPSLGLVGVTLLRQEIPLNFLAPFFLAFPLSVGYAIARHDLFSVDRYLRLGVVYAVLSGVVFVSWAVLVLGTELLFGAGARLPAGATPLYLLLVVAFFNPLRVRVQTLVDRLFYRQEYTYRTTIESTSRVLASVLNSDEIAQTVLRTLTEGMGVEWAVLLLVPGESSEEPRAWAAPPERAEAALSLFAEEGMSVTVAASDWTLHSRYDAERRAGLDEKERRPFDRLDAALVLPVRFQDQPIGLILLGDKMSRAYFSSQDLELLTTLTNQCALGFTNAEAYEIIKRTQGELVQAERLAAVGELASAVAHGIRNPLAGIRSSAQVGRDDLDEGIDASESFEDIISEADRLEQRVRGVLEMARAAELELGDGNLAKYMTDYVVEMGARLPAEIRLTVDLDRSPAAVVFDPVRLTEVLDTLVVNAIEAMDGRGALCVSSRLERENGEGGEAVLGVSDDGPGISSEVLDQVFDLFFTSKPQGTGVGLAMARRLIEQQGGRLEVSSTQGEGAAFHIHLRLTKGG